MQHEFLLQMIKKLLYVSSISLSLLLLFSYHPVLSEQRELYKWVDEKGTIHFTDRLSEVPLKYQNQIETKTFERRVKPAEKSEPATENNSKPFEPSEESDSQDKNTSESAELPAETPKRFEVPYEAFEGRARRIIISVTLNGSITAPMLLDTGASVMLISPYLADRLGLFDKRHGKLVTAAKGIGGPVPAILTIIDKVSVNGASAKCIPATIAPLPSSHFEGLMGMDFMANYRIGIDTRKHVVTFEELSSESDMPGGHDKSWWQDNSRRFSSAQVAWKNYLDKLDKVSMQTSEIKWFKRIAKHQYNEANKLHRKFEQYATWNSVPSHWRR